MRWAVGFAIALGAFEASAERASIQRAAPTPGICMREGAKFPGKRPVSVSSLARAPKKLRSPDIVYPELPSGTSASGIWMGEVLVNAKGKVTHIWPLREVHLTPPLPAFNQAIEQAIRQWEYAPLLLNDQPAPFCLTTTVNIHWK